MKKYFLLFLPVIVLLVFDYWFLFIKKEKKQEILIPEEPICSKECEEGERIILNDGSSWHILKIEENILTLFSDATIDLEGEFLPLNTLSMRNTGVPVPFDKQYERTIEKNPYCIFPDLGCSAYQKNNIDVFEDSYIKKIIDNNFLPKIIKTLETDNVIARLMKAEEFQYFKSLENLNNTKYNWLYYSGYWLMTPYTKYSVYVHKEETETLDVIAPYISYGYGIRPVIEVNYDVVLK